MRGSRPPTISSISTKELCSGDADVAADVPFGRRLQFLFLFCALLFFSFPITAISQRQTRGSVRCVTSYAGVIYSKQMTWKTGTYVCRLHTHTLESENES